MAMHFLPYPGCAWTGLVLAALLLSGCGPTAGPRESAVKVHRGEIRFGLSFEDRMAIPPQLSRLRAEAQRRANEIYDPFHSREDAARNEEYSSTTYQKSKRALVAERHLTDEELSEIVAEYQASLGADLR